MHLVPDMPRTAAGEVFKDRASPVIRRGAAFSPTLNRCSSRQLLITTTTWEWNQTPR
ncbi:hypothetical protein L842_5581 [Mycobacterium intracellulare MIN_052511_1280]|nr:hypothetical protein L842_5581 [Mycobacterium intracellulare MIN_052511_1280]